MRDRKFILLALILLITGRFSAHAVVVFNWPASPGWTAGAPTPGQTKNQSFTSVDPNDLTVSINNNGASGTGAQWVANYPAINSTNETGGLSGVNALQLFASSQSSTSSYIRTTVVFA